MVAVIYLHWTATGYDWIRRGALTSIIGDDGRMHRLHAYSVDLPAHTYGRNRKSVALYCACMGGILRPGFGGDRAWCRVVEFADEFGISLYYDPLVLAERRGG